MKNLKKLLSAFLALTMIACLFAGCSASGKKKTLKVAISPDFAPMEFVDVTKSGQDQFVGFDVTLAKYIAAEMGMELEIKPMSFDACQTAVSTGNVDMAISGFSWTEKRAENYNMSTWYRAGDNEDEQTMITLASNGDKFKDAANMEGLKVGAQTASLQEQKVLSQLPNAELVVYSDITTGIMQLKKGDFDCMAVAEGNGLSIIANNPDLALTGFYFEVSAEEKGNVILMKKGADELTDKVNEILNKAEAAGMYDPWYKEAKALAGTGSEISYDDEGNAMTEPSVETTAAETAAPETTVPETTVPETTAADNA